MDIKLLLVNSITLLYRESQQVGHTNNAADLALKVVEDVKTPELTMGREVRDRGTEVLTALRDTVFYMANLPFNHIYEPGELLQRLRINVGDDDITYEALESGIKPELSESALKRTCVNIKNQIRNFYREKEATEIISKAFSKLKYSKTKITNISAFVSELTEQLSPYLNNNLEKDPAVVDEVDFSNAADVAGVFRTVKEDDDGGFIMRTGFQGFNRMLDGGIRRGESIVNAALQHNFKTGSSLTTFRQLAVYNKPMMKDPTKKPMLLRISFEDSLKENFTFLYEQIWTNQHKTKPDITELGEEELAAYSMETMSANGYHIRMMRVNPSLWTYLDIQNKVLQLESEGYEIHVLSLDYLAMVPTTGCIMTTMGSDIRDMFRRMRNFTAPRGISFLTPHQLSTDAKRLIREGHGDLVKLINGKGYYDGCQRLDQEVDVEIYQHIEYVNGKAYMTYQRGKHRKTKQTPMIDRYFVLPMHEIGNLMDDVNDEDTTLRKPGGGKIGSSRELPVWDYSIDKVLQ